MQALKNIRILDFSKLLPGPLGTHLLATMGAEVIKIEKSDSRDYIRQQPPFVEHVSTLHFALNSLKEERVLDFASPEGMAEFISLLRSADVLIEQFRPGVMKHWGLDYDTLSAINPQLIYISLSGYGQTGPYSKEAGHDINYLSLSGVLDMLRDENGKPIIPGIQIADIAGGAYMLQTACLSALLERSRTGMGLYVDVSMTDNLLPLMVFPLSQYWGGFDQRAMRILSGGLVNYNVYECADGRWIALGALELKFWNSFCKAIEQKDWQREELFELSIHIFPKAELDALFKTRNRDEWAAWALGKDLCLTPVIELDELEQSAQIQAKKIIKIFKPQNGADMKRIDNPIL
jgi:crotonobetainyl-CoA:carnitine CoA-transferase CaiB-like acyl-CoA transferase